MVHLTYNDIERRKMPSPCKIGLFTRYHSETPCKVCPEQFAAYPETPERIRADCIRNAGTDRARTVSRYHAGADRKQLDRIPNSRNRYRPRRNDSALCNPAATDTDRNRNRPPKPCRPNQPEPITPNRSSFSRSARAGFFAALRSGERSRFTDPLLPCKEVLSAVFLR